MSDTINHPKHYNSHQSGVEAIELCRLLPFSIGNAVKYLMRAGLKETSTKKQDLLKAAWCLKDQASNPDFTISGKAVRIAKKTMEAEPYGTALYCLMALLVNLSWNAEDLARLSAVVEREAMALNDENKRPESYDVWQVRVKKDGKIQYLASFSAVQGEPCILFDGKVAESFFSAKDAFFFASLVKRRVVGGTMDFDEVKVFRTRHRKKS